MKIALASPHFPKSLNDGLSWVEKLVKEAAARQAEIICFPETYLPGYPGPDVKKCTPEQLQEALGKVCTIAAANSIAVIIPMDWYHNGDLLNIAHVISNTGEVLGYQTKNQLDPTEDSIWTPGTERRCKVWHNHLPRRVPVSRIRTLGGATGGCNRISSPFYGERYGGGAVDRMGRQR
jgi:predicted amidohydrolase